MERGTWSHKTDRYGMEHELEGKENEVVPPILLPLPCYVFLVRLRCPRCRQVDPVEHELERLVRLPAV